METSELGDLINISSNDYTGQKLPNVQALGKATMQHVLHQILTRALVTSRPLIDSHLAYLCFF